MKWKVMKVMNLLPSDPRVEQMNIYQWLWCYHNIVEDQKEEQELFKGQLDRLAFIINPEVAKKVFEHEENEKRKTERKNKQESKPKQKQKYKRESIYNNDLFDIETRAAMLGFDPTKGETLEQFMSRYEEEQKKEKILSKDLDSLLEEAEENQIPEKSNYVGDANEDADDFFERAINFEQFLLGEGGKNKSEQIIKKEEQEIDDDLDIFEVSEDE